MLSSQWKAGDIDSPNVGDASISFNSNQGRRRGRYYIIHTSSSFVALERGKRSLHRPPPAPAPSPLQRNPPPGRAVTACGGEKSR